MTHTKGPVSPEVKSLLVEQESPGGKLAAIYLVAGEDEATSSVCGCRIHRIESLQKGQSHVRMEFCPLHVAAPDLLVALDNLIANYGDKYLNEGSWAQARAAIAAAEGK